MTDETETEKRSVAEQAREAKEALRYSGEHEGVPTFEDLQKAQANFVRGRDPDAQVFKNVDAAYKHREEQHAERSENEEAEAAETAAQEQRTFEADVSATRTWNEQEEAVLAPARERAAKFQADHAAFNSAAANFMNALQREGADATPERQTQMRGAAQQLLAERERLLNEHGVLQSAEGKVRQALSTKQLAAEQKKLFRDVPELQDMENRKALAAWGKSHGLTDEELSKAAQDPGTVRRAWKQFQSEQEGTRREKVKAKIAKIGKSLNSNTSPMAVTRAVSTVEEARAELRRGGSVESALAVLTLERAERERPQKQSPSREKPTLDRGLARRLRQTI